MPLIPSLDLELNLRLGRRALRVVTLRQVEVETAAPEAAPVDSTGTVGLAVGHDDEHVLLKVEACGGARDGETTVVALGTTAVAELIDRLAAHAAEL